MTIPGFTAERSLTARPLPYRALGELQKVYHLCIPCWVSKMVTAMMVIVMVMALMVTAAEAGAGVT